MAVSSTRRPGITNDTFPAILENHEANDGDNGGDVTVVCTDGLGRPLVEKRIEVELRALPDLDDASNLGVRHLKLEDETGVLVAGGEFPGFVTAEQDAEAPPFELDVLLADAVPDL